MPSDLRTQWQLHPIDGGLLAFDRRTGLNVLARGPATTAFQRRAPRSLQIGLLTPCNLSCHFCYRDKSAPSRLTSPFLLDILSQAAVWGVLEVAFGGGEPLLFSGFTTLLQQLHERTNLGLNFTTNGTLLTPRIVEEVGEAVGEIRLSAYPDNHYRRTLRMLAGRDVGLNWLVTPDTVGQIEPVVYDALRLGARNVLLLGYKGPDESLHLDNRQLGQLRSTVERISHLPLRLDICWYPHLTDLPHLFGRPDCGAGDEFLVITPDRAIQPCSFHHERIPFETFEDLQRIYYELRALRPAAHSKGCTRPLFLTIEPPPKAPPSRWVWSARAGNNSGDWTIVGRFRNASDAQRAAESLRELARAHEAFLASPEGHTWIEQHDYNGSWPTPPLERFGREHGFDWSQEGEGLWWEVDGAGAPVLTAGAVGNAVVVYHPYCMGLPEEPFRRFFSAVGANDFGYWQYDQPSVVATAKGSNPEAVSALTHFLSLTQAAQHPHRVEEPPPWGLECEDPRVLKDEDRSARLATGPSSIDATTEQVRIVLTFENTFAGAVALDEWLRKFGFKEVDIALDVALDPLEHQPRTTVEPKRGLFGDLRPLADRLRTMSKPEVIESLFAYHSTVPDELAAAVAAIPPEERVRMARISWDRRRGQQTDVHWQALQIIQGAGPPAAEWMRSLWDILHAENYQAMGVAHRAMVASLPHDEAFSLACKWLETAASREEQAARLRHFGPLHHPGTAAFIERWWSSADKDIAITADWGRLAADSAVPWDVLRRWIVGGRPLSLIALQTLESYASRGAPDGYKFPPEAEFRSVLMDYQARDPAPRASSAVKHLLNATNKLATAT